MSVGMTEKGTGDDDVSSTSHHNGANHDHSDADTAWHPPSTRVAAKRPAASDEPLPTTSSVAGEDGVANVPPREPLAVDGMDAYACATARR